MLVEIQALVSPNSGGGSPRRAVIGWDGGRLAMVMAVLDTRCGLALGGNDVYLNVAGGLRVGEPAADLAVAAALLSSASDVPVPADMVVFGEIGLSGEVRAVGQAEARLKEAAKLGFTSALMPAVHRAGGKGRATEGPIAAKRIGHVQDLTALFRQGNNTAAGLKR
jgi:DNA repair protein RadA/Sms